MKIIQSWRHIICNNLFKERAERKSPCILLYPCGSRRRNQRYSQVEFSAVSIVDFVVLRLQVRVGCLGRRLWFTWLKLVHNKLRTVRSGDPVHAREARVSCGISHRHATASDVKNWEIPHMGRRICLSRGFPSRKWRNNTRATYMVKRGGKDGATDLSKELIQVQYKARRESRKVESRVIKRKM